MGIKKSRYEVILAGSGGQGLVVAGILLAEAAILEKRNVVQTVSHGIASRGGFSMAEVIIDAEEIIFQQVQRADVVLALTAEAMERFQCLADQDAYIFYDTTRVEEREGAMFDGRPFTALAAGIGHAAMANIVALGYMARRLGIVEASSLAQAIQQRFSGAARDANLNALAQGVRLAE